MAIARDPRATWKYVLIEDRVTVEEDGRQVQRLVDGYTTFHLRHLSLLSEQAAYDGIERTRDGSVVIASGARALAILREGLVGWDNLRDADGNDVPFQADKLGRPTDACLMRLSLDQRLELAAAIEGEIVLDPGEVGKSSPPST